MAIMGEIIAQGRTGRNGSRWAVEATGPWLDLLQQTRGTKARNSVVRWSLIEMGYVWASKFLGRRFTRYVQRAPFFYDMGTNAMVRKFRRMGLLQPILSKEFFGWDPWSNASPPRQLIERYRRTHPEAGGAFSRSGNYFTLSKTIRRDAKRIVREYVDDLEAKKTRPLVETGGAESAALAGHRVVATATQARQKVTISVPFGGPKNPLVGKVVRTMPNYEVAFMAKVLGPIMARRLSRTGLSAPGPLPVQRGTNDGSRKVA
jgi:hypothetical protein